MSPHSQDASPSLGSVDAAYAGRQVLVTGGFGFIGLNLVRRLVGAGAHVHILSPSPPPTHALQAIQGPTVVHIGDIRNVRDVTAAARRAALIFHCAGKSGPQDSNASPIDDLDVNVRGLLVLLEACKEVASGARVVFPSSRLVYAAETSIPVSEDAPTFPSSAYGVHKLAAERHLLLYRRLYGIGAVVLRITNPYGPFHRPGERRYGIVNWFIQRAVRGESIPIYGTGDQLRDYIHIDDVLEAMMVAGIHDRADGEILNIASGTGIRIRELAELIVSAAGRGAVVHVPWPDNARQVETGDFVADVSRARMLLQWSPRIGLGNGIRNVVAECGAAEWER